MGVVVWPMVELEADDALASAAHLAAKNKRVEKVCIWTPDKDLAQCVAGDRVVQIDRRKNADSRRACHSCKVWRGTGIHRRLSGASR